MKNSTIDLQSIKRVVIASFSMLKKWAAVLIFLIFTGIYGYIVVQINTLSNPVIDDEAVATEAKTVPTPKIDQDAATKLESLKDNSVNVKTLFEQGRKNPFEE